MIRGSSAITEKVKYEYSTVYMFLNPDVATSM